jgi:cell wall-associated NlpC family hydrolase
MATPTKTATPASPKPTPSAKPTAKPAATVPPGTTSDGLVGMATRQLGLAYAFGGSGPTSFDCSGLIWYVAKQVGKPVSRGLVGQYDAGSHPSRDSLKPGDLVFFQNTYVNGLSHVGIYVGNNTFIHAADEQSGVTLSSLTSDYWSSRFFGATRLS